ncbi:MAG: DUF427 domain-containing protein [Pseudomonadota bacterium]
MKAFWNGALIAESTETRLVENNHYFPLASVAAQYLQPSSTTSRCPWKGTAQYYNLLVDGRVNTDAVWYYPEPKDAAKQILGHVAFWKGVEIRP